MVRVKRVRVSKPLLIDEVEEQNIPIRNRNEVQLMLADAIERRDKWLHYYKSTKLSRKDNVEALRNYTALRGVVKTLQWVMLHPEVEHPLD